MMLWNPWVSKRALSVFSNIHESMSEFENTASRELTRTRQSPIRVRDCTGDLGELHGTCLSQPILLCFPPLKIAFGLSGTWQQQREQKKKKEIETEEEEEEGKKGPGLPQAPLLLSPSR